MKNDTESMASSLNGVMAPVAAANHRLPQAARRVMALLARLKVGTLTLYGPDGVAHVFGNHQAPFATLHIQRWEVCAAVLKSGDIGFAEAYMDGDWATPSLADLLRLFIANRREIESAIYGHWLGRLAYQLKHWLNRNNKTNSRKNIHAHYDLGNAFYELWLDGTMNYSSAWFEGDPTRDMADAQKAKVRRALRMVNAKPGDRVLEIGCGTGSTALRLAPFTRSLLATDVSSQMIAIAHQRQIQVAALRVPQGAGDQGNRGLCGTERHAQRPLGGGAGHAGQRGGLCHKGRVQKGGFCGAAAAGGAQVQVGGQHLVQPIHH